MRKYEAIVIFGPNTTKEEMEAALEKMKAAVSATGELVDVIEWGKKRFAYPIQKRTEGTYYLVLFNSGADVPTELKRIARITDCVFRLRVFLRDDTIPPIPPKREPRKRWNKERRPETSTEERKEEEKPESPSDKPATAEKPAEETPKAEPVVETAPKEEEVSQEEPKKEEENAE